VRVKHCAFNIDNIKTFALYQAAEDGL